MLQETIKIIEWTLYFSMLIFVFTTYYLIIIVKKQNISFIKKAVINPFLPNFKLSFLSELRNEYYKIKQSKVIIRANEVSFYFLLTGMLFLFLLVFLNEATQ